MREHPSNGVVRGGPRIEEWPRDARVERTQVEQRPAGIVDHHVVGQPTVASVAPADQTVGAGVLLAPGAPPARAAGRRRHQRHRVADRGCRLGIDVDAQGIDPTSRLVTEGERYGPPDGGPDLPAHLAHHQVAVAEPAPTHAHPDLVGSGLGHRHLDQPGRLQPVGDAVRPHEPVAHQPSPSPGPRASSPSSPSEPSAPADGSWPAATTAAASGSSTKADTTSAWPVWPNRSSTVDPTWR